MLDVGQRGGEGTDRGAVQAAARHEQADERHPAPELEPAGADIHMGDPVADNVEEGPDQDRTGPRTDNRPSGRAAADVERDDHGRQSRIGHEVRRFVTVREP